MKSLKQKNEEIRVEEKRKNNKIFRILYIIHLKKMYLESFFIIKRWSNSDHSKCTFFVNILRSGKDNCYNLRKIDFRHIFVTFLRKNQENF